MGWSSSRLKPEGGRSKQADISAKTSRLVGLAYDDGFRGGIALLATLILQTAFVLVPVQDAQVFTPGGLQWLLPSLCISLNVFSLTFVVWTHVLFTRTDATEAHRIAVAQYRRGPSRLSRTLGFGDESNWATMAAVTALFVSIAAAISSAREGFTWLPVLVVITAATSWATMVYAFALRYFRLNAGGETITFDIAEHTSGAPQFIDFVSMSVMVSSVGALSAGTPRTRASLAAVRTHTFIAFGFNALVVAMTVSLVTSLIASI